MANKKLLIEAARRFIMKCDSGAARSNESYAMFKRALKTEEAVPEVGLTQNELSDLLDKAESENDEVFSKVAESLKEGTPGVDDGKHCIKCGCP